MAATTWRAGSGAFVALAVFAWTASLLVGPGQGEQLEVFGLPFGTPCAFREEYGFPCPQCGMTRSWVWAARGHLLRSFAYNPAGSVLFLGLTGLGALGTLRLATARPNLPPIRLRVFAFGTAAWLVLWLGGWVLRVGLGVNPLP